MASDAEAKERFTLPSAPPGNYLRWLAFFREVEQRMGEKPGLESVAAALSAPFMRDEVAERISTDLIPQLASQAHEAQSRGDATVTPVIEAEPSLMRTMTEYVARRGAFLTPQVVSAMGIEPLDAKLVALRVEVITAVREQLEDRPASD